MCHGRKSPTIHCVRALSGMQRAFALKFDNCALVTTEEQIDHKRQQKSGQG